MKNSNVHSNKTSGIAAVIESSRQPNMTESIHASRRIYGIH